jgi:hypothetical protein
MRSCGLTAHDWFVVTDYIAASKSLKYGTKNLEGRGKSGAYGSIADITVLVQKLVSTTHEPPHRAYAPKRSTRDNSIKI